MHLIEKLKFEKKMPSIPCSALTCMATISMSVGYIRFTLNMGNMYT